MRVYQIRVLDRRRRCKDKPDSDNRKEGRRRHSHEQRLVLPSPPRMREGEWVEGQEGPYEKGVVEAGVEAGGTSGCIASRCMAIMPLRSTTHHVKILKREKR